MTNEIGYQLDLLPGFSSLEKEFLNDCMKMICQVINSANFKFEVLSADFKHNRLKNGLLSNSEIYKLVMTGIDAQNSSEDGLINATLGLFSGSASTIAKTSMTNGRIFLNKFHLKRNMGDENSGVANMCGTLFHEYTHKMGFKHPWFPPGFYTKSVPYVMGRIVNRLAVKVLDKKIELSPQLV